MDFKHILSSLRRSPTGAILVALQIALALAIAVNSLFIVVQRLELINRPNGIDVENVFAVAFMPLGDKFQGEATMREDLQALRSVPGVRAATVVNALPLSGGGSSTAVYTQPNEKGKRAPVNYFEVDEQGLETFGAPLAEGRNFDASIVRKLPRNSSEVPPEMILTRDAAKELFGDEPALGKTVYSALSQPAKIVGILDHMHGSWPGWEKVGNVALSPVIPDETYARYLVRAQPGQRDAVMKAAEVKLRALENGRVILRLRTANRIDQVTLPSLTPVWRSCEFQEREVFDLYGVVFSEHPDLRRILMWDEYKDYPMRKDYVEPDDYEWEPTPHGGVLEKAKQHYPAPAAQPVVQRSQASTQEGKP